MGPSIGASSSTTCWPGTSIGSPGCTGSWRPRCSRRWPTKHRSSVSKMARKYKATIDTPHGPRKCLQASVERGGRKPLVARFGGIPLRRQKDAAVTDRAPAPGIIRRKELVTRLLADRCEIYANTDGIQVHHVRRLADLDLPGPLRPAWADQMARRRRKTLVVCRSCHDAIHAGQPSPLLTQSSPESGVR